MLTPDQVRLRLEMARDEYTRGNSNDALHHVLTLLEEVLPSLVAPPIQPESGAKVDSSLPLPQVAGVAERLNVGSSVEAATIHRPNMVGDQTRVGALTPETTAVSSDDGEPIRPGEVAFGHSSPTIPLDVGNSRRSVVGASDMGTPGLERETVAGVASRRSDESDVGGGEKAIDTSLSGVGIHPLRDESVDHLETAADGVGPILQGHVSHLSRGNARPMASTSGALNYTKCERPESQFSADVQEDMENIRRTVAGSSDIAPCLSSEAPMTDERLTEIEAILALPGYECDGIAEVGMELLAEVRRLKRDNHLLSLSRGTPSVVGIEVR